MHAAASLAAATLLLAAWNGILVYRRPGAGTALVNARRYQEGGFSSYFKLAEKDV